MHNVHTQIAKECFNCGFSLCEKGQNRDDNFPQILLASYDSYITRVQKSWSYLTQTYFLYSLTDTFDN